MSVLIFGSSVFFVYFLIHLIIWKLKVPKRQTIALLKIFFLTLVLFVIFMIISSLSGQCNDYIPKNMSDYLHIFFLSLSLNLAYIITYTALEADSPSLVIILSIAEAGLNGISKKEFEQKMNNDILVNPRIKDLLLDKLVYLDSNIYKLTKKGILFISIFIIYRNLLNAPKGG